MKQYTPEELHEIYRKIAGGAGLWVPVRGPDERQTAGPAVGVYLRYSEVVPQASAVEQQYWDLLQQVPVINAVGVLAHISKTLATGARDAEVHRILNGRFLGAGLQKTVSDYRPGGPAFPVVFTRTGCLQLMRHVMLYGSNSTGGVDPPIETMGDLALLNNEFLRPDWLPAAAEPSSLELALQFVPVWDIDNPRDLAYALARMFIILREILPGADREVSKLSSAIGMNTSAITIDQLSLIDFISIVFGLYALGRDVVDKGGLAALFDYKRVLEKVSFPQPLLDSFIAKRSLTLPEFRQHLGGGTPGRRQSFDDEIKRRAFLTDSLNCFRKYPILNLGDNRAVILDLQFLVELLTSGVYWKIFDDLPSERRDTFRQLWGRLFELYAVGLLANAYPQASSVLAADVPYDGGQIDALLDFVEDAIVFEIKSSLLTERAKRGGNLEEFERDVTRKFVRNEEGKPKAVVQLVASCRAIANGKVPTATRPRSPSRIYPVLVSDEPCVEALCFNEYLNGVFQTELGQSSSIRSLTTMSINEFEETLAYVSQGTFGWPKLLGERFTENGVAALSVHQAIYNFRHARGFESCRNEFLLKRFEEVFAMIKKRYEPSRPVAEASGE